jgi:4-hydroxybenzoate polyprenyltransferase
LKPNVSLSSSQAGAAEPALPGRRRSAPSGGRELREASERGGHKLDGLKNKLSLYLQLIRWNRPAGWLLLLWPTLSALWVASHGFPGWHLLIVFTLGTILMRSAGCCINDVADRDFDRHVKRTAQRPVTSGQVSVKEALLLGAALALVAFGLVLTTNAVTIAWSFAALAVTLAYPYAKRFVSMPQAVLGVAFSFGIPMAFAAVQSRVPLLAWVMLAGNLFWVIAYDTEYAMVDRDDDLRIGMKTSAITLGRFDVATVVLCYAIYLSIWVAALMELAQAAIYLIAIGVAGLQALWHGWLIRKREREACFKAFRLNHWLGFTVFAGVVLAYAGR